MSEISEYWDRKPCEAWHGTAPAGSQKWSFEVMKQRYFVQPHIIKFADFPRWKDKLVLEIGCGIGTDLLMFSHYGAEVWGVDDSYVSLDLALERFLPYPDRKYKIVVDNAEEWLPLGPFDLIYSFGVLHHTPHPEKVLRLAHERLKDTGELRIMLYAKYSWKHFWHMQPEAQPGCPHVKWYSKREAKELLESCGFRVVSIEKTHIFPWRIKDYIEHGFVRAFPWNVIPRRWFAWLESKLGHHLLIKAVKA